MSAPVAGKTEIADEATATGLLSAHELKAGEIVAGRFRIESLLGIGGMGVVYRARDLSLDIDVAIKLLRPELARRPEAFERFRNELLLARQVSSPHVVRIHDIAQHGERWLISMDFVDGESLEQRLERHGRLATDEAVAITRALLSGLAAAHQRGVVHRDLKPANILIDRSDCAFITDFGVARSLGATGMTQSGLIVGTPEYLSPEQARGDAVDGRSDLYTVGLILYEALTGSLPFAGGTPAETVMRRLVRPPPSLAKSRPELPHWLHAFTDRLLKLTPAHRFRSATEALSALDLRRVPRPPLNRRALLLGALMLVTLLAAVHLAWRYWPTLGAPTAVAAVKRSIALLPLRVSDDAAALQPLVRALDEHARTWLRSDPTLAVATRERTLAALARAAPDSHGEALSRRLPDIARAASAQRLLRGELRRENTGLVLDLSLESPGDGATAQAVTARGVDESALYTDYLRALASLAAAAPPSLPAEALSRYGEGLLALDRQQASAAVPLLETLVGHDADALLLSALLQAQETAQQAVSAQATRGLVLERYASDTSLSGLAVYAQAVAGNGDAAASQAALERAVGAFPLDPALILAAAEAQAANGEGAQALIRLESRVDSDGQDARAWYLLGRTAIQQGQAQRAVDDYLVRALVLWTRAGDVRAEAETRNAMGVGYERLGQLDAAVEQYIRAAGMREKIADLRGYATTLRNLAVVQAIRGERDAAEASLDKARSALESLGDRASIADLHNDRGVVAEERGDFRAALAAFREALALRQQLDLPASVAQSLNNVAFCYFQLGEGDNAAVYWQQALAMYQKIDDREGGLHVMQSLGLMELTRGHHAVAASQLADSLRQAQDLQLPEEVAVAHVYLGELAFAEGRLADAINASELALAGFERRADQRGLAEARLLAARSWLAAGDVDAASTALDGVVPAQLSPEQQAVYALAQARVRQLRGDMAAAAVALGEAQDLAEQAHSAAAALEIRIERARAALASADSKKATLLINELGRDAARLGQAPLRLEVIELELARGLRLAKTPMPIASYREAQPLLQQLGKWRNAAALHSLGARVLTRAGQKAEAAAAEQAANDAREQLVGAVPESARASVVTELQRRLRQESGDGDNT